MNMNSLNNLFICLLGSYDKNNHNLPFAKASE